jgi:hypothetical protein
VTQQDVENALKARIADIMSTLVQANVQVVTIVTNHYVRKTVNPLDIAFRFGLSCIEKPSISIYPARHFIKPLLGIKDYIVNIYTQINRVKDIGHDICVFPTFQDNDIMMPLLLTKYHCMIYSGFVWNQSSVCDMLGDPYHAEGIILKEVAYLQLFPSQPDMNR